jgi:uncharacterized membrane protein YidH (DUF202 family)
MKTENDREPSVLEYAVILILIAIVMMATMPFVKIKQAVQHRMHLTAQHRMHLTAFGVVLLAILAGVGVYWLAFIH